MRKTFQTPEPIEVRARLAAGKLDVEAAETSETVVVVEPANQPALDSIDRVRVELKDSKLFVEAPDHWGLFSRNAQFDVRIVCPTGSRLEATAASADVHTKGTLQRLEVKTASGDVDAEACTGDARMKTASGAIGLASCGGLAEVTTVSGSARIGRAAAGIKASVVSGDLSVGECDGGGSVSSVSGDIELGAVGYGSFRATAVSGDIKLGIRPGLDVWMDVRSLSGHTISELEPVEGPAGDRSRLVQLRVSTTSGNVRIRRTSEVAVG